MFAPLPAAVPSEAGEPTEAAITLGRMLYYEPRLSKDQTISCNTCHDLANYGIDPEPTSTGHKGQKGDRNSPTVLNAAAHFVQFWDGRAADVEAQAKGPVLNPVEMAMPGEARVVAVLESMPEYVDLFKQAFPGDKRPVSYDNMAKAIGAFERKLMTPSRWDALLKGDASALTPEETIGLKTFLEAGCQACHYGALLGGTSYQKLGAVEAVSELRRPRPLHGHEGAARQGRVQGAVAAERREDRALLSQRPGHQPRTGGPRHGGVPTGRRSWATIRSRRSCRS